MKIPNPHAAFMAFACALFAACSPQQPFITSPDGRIAVSVEADAGAGVTYAVTVDDKPLILPLGDGARGMRNLAAGSDDNRRMALLPRQAVDSPLGREQAAPQPLQRNVRRSAEAG